MPLEKKNMSTIIGPALPNIPWEDKPAGCSDVVWRYSRNPVIPARPIPKANSVFNSAVVPFEGEFRGVFRVDTRARHMCLHAGSSKDGVNWTINPEMIEFETKSPDPDVSPRGGGYDPRVGWLEDRWYVTWCSGNHGPTIGMAWTKDFKTFHRMESATLPCNRNGVLFPRRINGMYMMLSRPSDRGHTPFGDIFCSQSPDLIHWGRHRFVMAPNGGWQATKIGPGPIPIETSEGWLMFYHGVITQCNGFVYSFGAALLDLDEPWKVKYRTSPYLLAPSEMYERIGDTDNVVFPCGALVDAPTGRLAIYYGAADTVTALCFCQAEELIDFIKTHSRL